MDNDINSRNSDNYVDINGSPVKRVVNIDQLGNLTNPATSDNQINLQSILEAVETTQEEIKSLNETILELVSRLSVLGAVKGVSGDLRVTPLSTPNMSTLTNVAQIGGSVANTVVEDIMNISAQLSNINNIV